jgi:SPP1 family predicted phage head-tail adaptor
MRIGECDRRLKLEAPVETDEEGGGIAVSFLDKGWLWAMVAERPGPERSAADTVVGANSLVVTTHYRGDLRRGMRLIDSTRIYRIIAVEAIGRRLSQAVCEEESESSRQ